MNYNFLRNNCSFQNYEKIIKWLNNLIDIYSWGKSKVIQMVRDEKSNY